MTLLQLFGCFSSQKVPKREIASAALLKPFDAIIVPGIPFKNCEWDTVMKGRVIWAYILYKDGFTKNIIFSGSSVYSPYFESKIMGLYAQKLGIPKEHIFYETEARHSTENVYFSYLLAKKLGFKSLALATDPVQSRLLRGFTRKRFGSPIHHLPFVINTLKEYNHLNPSIDPTSAKAENFISITEKESFWQRMRGTLGKDIDWSQYEDGKVGGL
ncbi:MAG: hypothetical protein K0Q79_2128 [Flavipsychrobacter sp.]|jgi:uncharacterized SAM-binding protein YcdF (DUF218 family)|nr:hypothetical protein [Flavipsychrobacter sp.]